MKNETSFIRFLKPLFLTLFTPPNPVIERKVEVERNLIFTKKSVDQNRFGVYTVVTGLGNESQPSLKTR
jgi:hypothetical protein